MPAPPDAAALETLKAAHESLTAGRTLNAVTVFDHINFRDIEDIDRVLLLLNAAPALVAGCETLLDVERKYRLELWLHHGHHGVALYGDDGEMQCHVCRIWDYRRAPLADLELQVEDARRSQALAALDAAREE